MQTIIYYKESIFYKIHNNIDVIIAPSLLTEGKGYQKVQSLGMYK